MKKLSLAALVLLAVGYSLYTGSLEVLVAAVATVLAIAMPSGGVKKRKIKVRMVA